MRRIFAAIAFVVCAIAFSNAQIMPRSFTPDSDPTAFSITTQADLEDALNRIARLKASLRTAPDAEERRFLMTSILEICQRELNREANTSGVVVVERAPEHARVPGLALRWQGAFSSIEDQIRSLGPDGMKLYEELFGPRVRLLLADAMQTRDRNRMSDLNRRFGLTLGGAEAAAALAALHWEEGSLAQAARMLERALENAAAIPAANRAYLYAWLSHCYRERGERAALRRILDESAAIHNESVKEGEAAVTLGDLLTRRLAEARDGASDTIDRRGVHWPGGNYANTGLYEKPTNYSKAAWAQNLPALSASPHNTRFMKYKPPIVPPHLPIFDGSVIYVNQGDQLVAYDLVNGARGPMWSCKPFPTFGHNWRTIEPDPSLILPVSVHRGTVYAALENPLSTAYHNMHPDPNFQLHSHYPKVRRALCAVDGSTGRLLWKVGGEYEGDALSTTSFLSAVVYEGVLYAIASKVESLSDVFLVALKPDSGDVLWKLRLCYGQQETTMFGRPAREPLASLPAISGSLLYLCTNIGGVVAVDLNTRGIRWVSRYEYMPRPVSKYIDTYYRDVTWYNSPTIYAEHQGKAYVIIAPTDADYMFAFDAASGKEIWRLARHGQPLYGGRALVGLRDGVAFVAGDGGDRGGGASMLHTVDITNGRVTKSIRVTREANGSGTITLAGRPCMASNRLLWPGFDAGGTSVIAEVELDSMRAVNSATVPASYGGAGFSVFAQHGVVFTVAGRDYARGNSQLAVRFDAEELLRTARKELESNPDDADAHLRLGLLTLRLGNRAEGMKSIRRAYELAASPPPNTRVRDQASHALVDEYLGQADAALLRRQYIEAMGLVAQARGFAVTRSQRTECFLREEKAILASGNAGDALEFYRAIIKANPDFGIGADPELPAQLYATIRVAGLISESAPAEAVELYHRLFDANQRLAYQGTPVRALALGKLREILVRSGREAFTETEQASAALMAAANADAWRRVLEKYPLSRASDDAAFKLAEHELFNFRAEAAAEVVRAALEDFNERTRANDLHVVMAVAYSRAGQTLRARLVAGRVLRASPEGKLTLLGREQTYKELLEPLLKDGDRDSANEALPRLPGSMMELWRKPWEVGGFTRLPLQPTASGGKLFVGQRTRSGTSLVAIEAATGKELWARETEVTVTDTRRTSRGTLFVLNQGFALHDDEGNEVWTAATGGAPDPISLQAGMLIYGTRFLNTRTRRNMVRISARDAASGGEVWETPVEAVSVRWIGQSVSGIQVLLMGDETQLVLLDPESGEERARASVPTDGRITVSPVATDRHIIVADRDGKLHFFDADTLKAGLVHDTRVRYPTLLESRGDKLVVVGLNSVTLYDPASAETVWRVDNAQTEMVTGNLLLPEQLILATRSPGNLAKVTGYSLTDGKQTFTYSLSRENDNDRVELQSAAQFAGGIVAVYSENRIVDGRLRLWGFRMLVLNSDGTERFKWEHRVEDSPLFVQLALTEDYIGLTCDNTTFGFGRAK